MKKNRKVRRVPERHEFDHTEIKHFFVTGETCIDVEDGGYKVSVTCPYLLEKKTVDRVLCDIGKIIMDVDNMEVKE